MDQKPTVHVVFGMSAAGTLRIALRKIGRAERVIGQNDNLSFGPIDGDRSKRLEWLDKELAYDYTEVPELDTLFWGEAVSPDIRPIAWVNRRSAREYSGFLEFLWRLPHTNLEVVDGTDVVFSRGRAGTFVAHSLGVVSQEQMIEARLMDRQQNLSAFDIENYKAAWNRLRAENAPLRIVEASGLFLRRSLTSIALSRRL